MKKFVFALALSVVSALSFGQNGTPDQSTTLTEVTIAELQLVPMRMPSLQDIGGSPFLHAEYHTGAVQFNAGRMVNNVPMKFNVFNNVIMVQRDGDELKLETFDMVSYEDGGKTFVFKQGYPEVDNRPTTAVYQVLAFGPKIHLVKFVSQKVEDAPTLGDYSRREIVTTSQLYVYVPGGEMKKVKSIKSAINDALPGMSAKIDEVIKTESLNLKNEADMVALVNALNK